MKRLRLTQLLFGLAVLAQSLPASATYGYLQEFRCAQDKLANMDQVTQRDLFAKRCYPDLWAILSWNDDPSQNTYKFSNDNVDRVIYPVFGYPTADKKNVVIVPAPIDGNADCAKFANQIPNVRVVIVGFCGLGCLTPDQVVEFGDKPMQIGSDEAKSQQRLLTLKEGSEIGAVSLKISPLQQIVSDIEPTKQDILTMTMASGVQLKTTLNHPLVDGEGVVQRADKFQAGDELIRADGNPEKIAQIEKSSYTGRVYNIRVASKVLEDNIYVAQGYLNGSIGIQNDQVEKANRLLLRHGELFDLSGIQ